MKAVSHLVAPGSLLLALMSATILPVQPYPQFQQFSETHSGRVTDCSMCHLNSEGPLGQGLAQEGSLTPAEMNRLNKSRAAMEPGMHIDNPTLNQFGNHIMEVLGGRKVMELRMKPQELSAALGNSSDLDGDGIPDSQEYLDGTDPLNANHGDPSRFLWIDLRRHYWQIILTIIGVLSINWGLNLLIRAFNMKSLDKDSSHST